MIKTARQLKDLIRNLSREKSADAQILMRNYMMERFLERISLSEYRDKFILKGGMLVAAMVGLDARSTMDLDATIKGAICSLREGHQLMKKHGHYCKVCGEYKANEKFSGKGHASHICKSCASLPAEKQAELMTLNRLFNLPWRLSKEQLSWLKNRLKDRRPDVRELAQEQYEMRFPPRHLEDDDFNFFDEESFIE